MYSIHPFPMIIPSSCGPIRDFSPQHFLFFFFSSCAFWRAPFARTRTSFVKRRNKPPVPLPKPWPWPWAIPPFEEKTSTEWDGARGPATATLPHEHCTGREYGERGPRARSLPRNRYGVKEDEDEQYDTRGSRRFAPLQHAPLQVPQWSGRRFAGSNSALKWHWFPAPQRPRAKRGPSLSQGGLISGVWPSVCNGMDMEMGIAMGPNEGAAAFSPNFDGRQVLVKRGTN